MVAIFVRSILAVFALVPLAHAAPTHLVEEKPVSISQPEPGIFLVDFGRVAFANLQLSADADATNRVTAHFGEALSENRINRKPPGSVRYQKTGVSLEGPEPVIVAPPADRRNTRRGSSRKPPAVLTPADWGVLLPFRWVEIEGWPGELRADQVIRRSAYSSSWQDEAASFESSDDLLDRIWALSRYSIKATSFAGIYIDGDRERIPYEADAYLNQLSHFYTDNDVQMSRDTFDHLMQHGTWPTEWAAHMVFMAHTDWMHTGDRQWLAQRYEALKKKLLLKRAGRDGLIKSSRRQIKKGDIVDWPPAERDGYVFSKVNTVVNAFHLESLKLMASMARALGKESDSAYFENAMQGAYIAFQNKLYSSDAGLYRDGTGTEHSSLHANLFPLAFGLVPDDKRTAVTGWLADRGMACSVYAAQYLLQGLFENGAGARALELITAPGDRSWRHMLESGTTITWEAWDMKYKPNQDWNHAWGAAPANLLPRYVLGAEPHAPGWSRARIRPIPGKLAYARGKIPTPRGPILVDWNRDSIFTLSLELPLGMTASIDLPAPPESKGVQLNGQPVKARRVGARWHIEEHATGKSVFEVI